MKCECNLFEIDKLLTIGGGSFILLGHSTVNLDVVNSLSKNLEVVIKHCDPFLTSQGCSKFQDSLY